MTTATGTKSLVELLGEEQPNPDDVVATLRSYSEHGAAILAESVVGILGKTDMTQRHLHMAWNYLNQGYAMHTQMAHDEDKPAEIMEAGEYATAREFVASRIREQITY